MISRKNILQLEKRQKIYDFILKNPGVHLREISRRTNIPKTTLGHHLRYLEKQELIIISTHDNKNEYCASNKVGKMEKKLINALRKKTPRNMIIYFICYIVCSQIELSRELEKDPSTIAFNIKKLQDLDLIEPVPFRKEFVYIRGPPYIIEHKNDKSEKFYKLKNPDPLYNLLIKYEYSLLKDVKEVLYILKYGEYSHFEGNPKSLKVGNKFIDKIIENVLEILPHPYYA